MIRLLTLEYHVLTVDSTVTNKMLNRCLNILDWSFIQGMLKCVLNWDWKSREIALMNVAIDRWLSTADQHNCVGHVMFMYIYMFTSCGEKMQTL